MERMQRFKDKTPFSIENDIIDENIDSEAMDEKLKDDSEKSEDFKLLASWAKDILGDLVKELHEAKYFLQPRYQKIY